MKENNILVVLPVRSGSKGIRKKNIYKINNKELLNYAVHEINNLKNNLTFAISSNSDKILKSINVIKKNYIKIKRPASLAKDNTTLDPVIFHAFNYAEKKLNKFFSKIVTIQATSPLMTYVDIQKAIKKFDIKKYDSLISVIEDTHLRWRLKKNRYYPLFKKRVNRQKLEKDFRETGSFQICSRKQILTGKRLGKKILFYEIKPKIRGLDIDTLHDMYIAEHVLKNRNKFF